MTSWLSKLMPSRIRTEGASKRTVPEGVWEQCPNCASALYKPELERNLFVCPNCAHHLPLAARERLKQLFDGGIGQEIGAELNPTDPLNFKDGKKYKDRLVASQKATGEKDALVAMAGKLKSENLVACAFEFGFMGGSMGSVVGERFARAGERALELKSPMICFAASGGARMQEGLFSLMQMAKTAAVIARMRRAGLPFVSVLTHPTTGGVSASLAMLGDLNVAEPNALIGFAGPRVIEQTVRETLPAGFQRSEFLLEHGHIDMILDRREMRDKFAQMFALMMQAKK